MMALRLDLNVLAAKVPFEEAVGPRAGYSPEAAARIRRKIADRVGEEPITILGSGDMGVVYGLPSGKVLKLTHDQTEVEALSKLVDARHPGIVQVFDAFFAVEDPEKPVPVGVGAVVREAIDHTMQTGDFEISKAFTMATAAGESAYQRTLNICSAMDAYVAQLDAEVEPMGFFSREIAGQVKDALAELRRRGICSYDFAPGNIGVIMGRPVLYDVGVASVKGARPDVV